MAKEIKMPQLSDTMDKGKILAWQKNEGDAVERGDILAEVETDKANLEIESFDAGTLLQIRTPAGQEASVGEIIAVIGEPGEAIPDSAPAKNGTAPKINQTAETTSTPASPEPVQQTPTLQTPSPSAHMTEGRIIASPLAKKIARERNIELNQIRGTGPNGRIIKRDVEAATELKNQTAIQQPAPQPTQSAATTEYTKPQTQITPAEGGTITPLSKMRETIAKRMQQSVNESPHFYTTACINMMEVKRTREALKETPGYEGVSYNHFILKAAAYAIEREPRVNNAMREGMLYTPNGINIGIITALNEGLLIPVLHNANKLSLKDVVFEARALVDRARAGRPNATDLTGGTFSISNMGMFDVDSFTAIINPGQGSVLAVSAIKEEPVVMNGLVVPGLTMKATISVDHRIIDGIMSGNFLKHFKQALETPALLMV
ncbi:MAG: 2-oxo acid dehydrogenase subunit E2 [Deltaproteobacteria bacterium]|nr:2-oxo acid dehydrogenase subunit E2 [Deltaproteobacteria bacterium]